MVSFMRWNLGYIQSVPYGLAGGDVFIELPDTEKRSMDESAWITSKEYVWNSRCSQVQKTKKDLSKLGMKWSIVKDSVKLISDSCTRR